MLLSYRVKRLIVTSRLRYYFIFVIDIGYNTEKNLLLDLHLG